jgi:PAS domain-containing protein
LTYKPGDVIGQLSPLVFHSQAEIDRHADEIWHHFNERVSGFNTLVFKAKRFGSETHHWTYIACDGAQVPVSVAITGIFNESEELVGYLCIATDISRQLEHERDILAARDQLEMAASMANLGIWTWTLADDGLQWNDFMYSLYYDQPKGDKNASLDFDHWQKCIHPDDLEPTSTSLAAAINGTGSYDLVFRIILPDGRIRFVQAGARVERNSSGEAIRVTGFNLDVTSQQELEAMLRSAKEQSDAASAAAVRHCCRACALDLNQVSGIARQAERDSRHLRHLRVETLPKLDPGDVDQDSPVRAVITSNLSIRVQSWRSQATTDCLWNY